MTRVGRVLLDAAAIWTAVACGAVGMIGAFGLSAVIGGVTATTASAQDCPPPAWNPDANGDGAVGLPDLLALLGVYNQNVAATDGPCGIFDQITFDGHNYPLVAIGDQCWFAENLRTATYANGDTIPGNLSYTAWTNPTEGAQAYYYQLEEYLATYGRLYNWLAVDDPRGVCPSGWHVPSDEEWKTLEMHLGMTEEEANDGGWRGTDEGDQIKSSPPHFTGTNTAGLSVTPGGWKDNYYGAFQFEGERAYFWTSTSYGGPNLAWFRYLDAAHSDIYRFNLDVAYGYSVRCMKN